MTPDASPPNRSDDDPLSTLSPAEAEAIYAQDLRNILLKVKELKPLTDREREIIRQRTVAPAPEESADVCGFSGHPNSPHAEPKWAKTVVDLAAIIGVERRTIGNWRQQPGCPAPRNNGQYLVSEWRDFARQIGSPTAAAAAGVAATDDKRELEARKLRAECEEREHKLAVRRGEYTPNDVIGEQLAALVQEAISVLRAKFERELPAEYKGEPISDAALNKTAIDEVCQRLSRPLPCQESAPQPDGGDDDE